MSPPPHTPSIETTLPNSDEHRRHSSATVAAQWRPNATQSQSALLACGAGHSDQGDRRRDPCTGLFARRRPRRPLNQTASSATWRHAASMAMRARWRPHLSSTPRSAVDSKPTRSTRSNSGQEPSCVIKAAVIKAAGSKTPCVPAATGGNGRDKRNFPGKGSTSRF